jgi:predicted ATPase
MQHPLVDFLNHGVLPFVGRGPQVERIISFWRETADAHGLRALLLTGEAGIGKSRLVEESMREIIGTGGAVVHVRLYPDATASLAPLLARGIWTSGAGRRLLKNEPEETLPSIAAALRRMCRLRPTLLVIEDIHLLSGEPLAQFASLLGMLAEESLSLLCAARPLEDSVLSVLQRYLIEEIEITGLERERLDELWCR